MLARRLFLSNPLRSSILYRFQSSTSNEPTQSSEPVKVDFSELIEEVTTKPADDNISFAKLLRHSKFVQLGDFDGRTMEGKIVHRVNDDLYIDFGLKFNAVCKAPSVDGQMYTIGSRVLIRLYNPELSEKFLGSKHDLTLLEADATLIKLLGVPGQRRKQEVEVEKTE